MKGVGVSELNKDKEEATEQPQPVAFYARSATEFSCEEGDVFYESVATVCMLHYRFIPCRRCVNPEPVWWSADQVDVDLVRHIQQGNIA